MGEKFKRIGQTRAQMALLNGPISRFIAPARCAPQTAPLLAAASISRRHSLGSDMLAPVTGPCGRREKTTEGAKAAKGAKDAKDAKDGRASQRGAKKAPATMGNLDKCGCRRRASSLPRILLLSRPSARPAKSGPRGK